MAHTHEEQENYFLDQIFTIALCGALGGIAVMMYLNQTMLNVILDQKFHLYVFLGGIALLVLVAVRAVAVWRLAGAAQPEPTGANAHHHHDHAHDHAHEHEHEHAHEHADCGHEHAACCGHHEHGHDHAHDHGWAPWRYTILLLPVVLYFLNLPNDAFSARYVDQQVDASTLIAQPVARTMALAACPLAPTSLVAAMPLCAEDLARQEIIHGLRFSQLEKWAYDPVMRELHQGKTATLIGKFVASPDNKRFGLVRYQMNCCAADALPLNAVIMVDPTWKGEALNSRARNQQWVKVTGRIHFFKKPGPREEYVSALIVTPRRKTEDDKAVTPNDLVEIVEQPANPYAD